MSYLNITIIDDARECLDDAQETLEGIYDEFQQQFIDLDVCLDDWFDDVVESAVDLGDFLNGYVPAWRKTVEDALRETLSDLRGEKVEQLVAERVGEDVRNTFRNAVMDAAQVKMDVDVDGTLTREPWTYEYANEVAARLEGALKRWNETVGTLRKQIEEELS